MQTYIHDLGSAFKAVVGKQPDAIAISFPDGSTKSFEQLNADSDKIVRLLIKKGLKKYDVCAIAGVKQAYTYASFIACLKLGITYTFFDPESPWERLSRIFRQCGPKLVLGYMDQVLEKIDADVYDQVDLGSGRSAIDLPNVESTAPAYIMFTSGSTGFPKGAVMNHQNLLNFIAWGKQTYNITPSDIHTNLNPLYFDNSVFDIYCSLFNGAQLVPIERKESINPRQLLEIIQQKACTTWFSVPSLLIYLQSARAIIPERWQSVQKIIFGGEGYPKAKLVKLYNALRHNTTLYNVYGPTECTCICSSYTVGEGDFEDLTGFLPLGAMAPNFSWMIMDEAGKPADDKGELWLGGPNVGYGYYNDMERTSQSFVQNPFHNKYRDIYYRTGDLVSFDKDNGKINIHGRTDHQIKHMGYRIELEEIENAFVQLPYINEAAVFVVNDTNNNKIVGVFESDAEIDHKTLKEELKKFLPYYMLPSEMYRVERLPKNANGKTDRPGLKKEYESKWQK